MCDRKRITGGDLRSVRGDPFPDPLDHDDPDDPLTIYDELSDERYELRKVEEFADGLARKFLHPPLSFSFRGRRWYGWHDSMQRVAKTYSYSRPFWSVNAEKPAQPDRTRAV